METKVYFPYAVDGKSIYKVGKDFKYAKPTRTLKQLLLEMDMNISIKEKNKVMSSLTTLVTVYVKSLDFVPSQLFIWLSNTIDNGRKVGEWEEFFNSHFATIAPSKREWYLEELENEKLEEKTEEAQLKEILDHEDTTQSI